MIKPLELKEPKTRPKSGTEVEHEPKLKPKLYLSWAAVASRRPPPKSFLQQPRNHQGPSERPLPPRPPPQQSITHQGASPHPLPPRPPPQQPTRHSLPPNRSPHDPHPNQQTFQQLPAKQPPTQQPSGQEPPTTGLLPEQTARQSVPSRQPSSEQLPSRQAIFQKRPDRPLRRPTAYLLRFEQAHPGFGIDNTVVTRSVFATELDALTRAINSTEALIEEHKKGYGVDEDNPSLWVHGGEMLHHRVVLRVEIVAIKHLVGAEQEERMEAEEGKEDEEEKEDWETAEEEWQTAEEAWIS
ncbi:hypothetical protein MMC30_009314 [Trapelia coarctata]|nr:hypothetical protein [Trapelia coarctata]